MESSHLGVVLGNSTDVHQADHGPRLFEFELNPEIRLENESFGECLRSVVDYISSHKMLHDWEEKLTQTPLKALTSAARAYLARTAYSRTSDAILSQSVVEEIFTLGNTMHRQPLVNDDGGPQGRLVFSKVRL